MPRPVSYPAHSIAISTWVRISPAKRYKPKRRPGLRGAMETESLFSSSSNPAGEIGGEILFLALLLTQVESSPTVVAAGASKSNLFFSRMFGASAEANFGPRPDNQPQL